MIHLEPVTKENLEAVLALRTKEEQAGFVSTTAESLAQAYVYHETAFPFAVYNDQTVVGFIMMGYYGEKQYYTLWKLLIDRDCQSRGYGKAALELGIAFLKDHFPVNGIYTGVLPENNAAKRLYQSVGFEDTGLFENGMQEMCLKCRQSGEPERKDQRGGRQTEYRWTDGNDGDFHRFYLETEAYYSRIVGGLQNRQAFVPYNLSESISDVVIAGVNGTAVGCAGLKAYSDSDAEIKRVWVEPAYRRNHIADEMMDRIERKAKELGFRRVILQTRAIMQEAVGLYRKRGYRRIDNYPPYDRLDGAICFAKDL